MSENAARILPLVGTIALHLMLGYFLPDTGLKKSDTSPEISIKVTFINSASVEKSSAVKAKPKREKPIEKAADITKPKITIHCHKNLRKGIKILPLLSHIIMPKLSIIPRQLTLLLLADLDRKVQ